MSKGVGGRISVVHSTLNTLVSSGGEVLCDVSTIWSVESLLEPEQEVDWCCVVVCCLAERSSSL